ncbi:DUF5828 family protein [Halolamina litorea]|uniref:DUF5828 family protein n=1 Tax=Halolamina litorea TaxID=1515593 RepID=A0ABD6BUV2_9EURY|nr:DUF5828 family protein [Halolamina litorea]
MEESIAGFKQRGSWGDVVEHGERITRALRDAGVDGDAFEAWDEWRPKAHETLDEDVEEKTAEQASIQEGPGEREGKEPEDDIKSAGEKLTESYEKVEEGDNGGAIERWQDSIGYATRAADSASRKAIRTVEDTVYRKVMTQLAPYYFDNELVSANVQQSSRGAEAEFVFEVNINDDDLKSEVSERLSEYDDQIDRWHVDVEKETVTAEAAEGVEVPPTEGEGRSKSTTN